MVDFSRSSTTKNPNKRSVKSLWLNVKISVQSTWLAKFIWGGVVGLIAVKCWGLEKWVALSRSDDFFFFSVMGFLAFDFFFNSWSHWPSCRPHTSPILFHVFSLSTSLFWYFNCHQMWLISRWLWYHLPYSSGGQNKYFPLIFFTYYHTIFILWSYMFKCSF